MKADNIDGVLALLDELVDQSIQDADPHGIFIALYRQMTLRVKQGIVEGLFDDNPRMDRFDTLFANRYLAAGPIALNDDGRGGDPVAGDGSYEADYTFPTLFRGTELVVVAGFTDMVGNVAVPLEWDDRISFTDPPEAVQLIGAIDSTVSMITIRWSESIFRLCRVRVTSSS